MATVAGLAPIVFLGLFFPLRSHAGAPALGDAVPTWIPMPVALVGALAAGWLVACWSVSEGFTVRHRILMIGAAMVGHSLFAVVSGAAGTTWSPRWSAPR